MLAVTPTENHSFGANVRAAGVVVEDAPGVKPRIDLKRANRVLLERAGVPPDAIDAGDECTSSDRGRFYSYRRDRGETGQHLGFIGRMDTSSTL